MARYSEHDTSKIYQAADAFRANCLLHHGSLLFADAAGSHIEEVEEEAEAVEQMAAESEQIETVQVDTLPEGAKINLLAPSGHGAN